MTLSFFFLFLMSSQGSRAVLYFLRDLATGGGECCNRVKLLVTGQANVGKTSLLAALKNEVGSVNRVLRLLTGKVRCFCFVAKTIKQTIKQKNK